MSNGDNKIVVVAPSRLHLGLHDCGYSTDRVFGGIGVSVNGFETIIEVIKSQENKVFFEGGVIVSPRLANSIDELLAGIGKITGPVTIKVKKIAPEHRGFGAKTALLLSIAKSMIAVRGLESEYSVEDIIILTGRGGTSGIGVNSFWHGGLIADSGHFEDTANRIFQPSSKRCPTEISKVISRVNMPTNWRVSLFDNLLAKTYEGLTESEAFIQNMPINDIDNLRSIAITYHAIIPSALDGNIARFAKAINDMNHYGMKSIEINLQPKSSKNFLEKTWERNYAAGLSSFGPTMYIIHEDDDSIVLELKMIARSSHVEYLGTFEFNNAGASFS